MPKTSRSRRSKSKTGYIGSIKNADGHKYTARICINRKYKGLGSSYETAKEAAKAYDKHAIKLRRPFSKLNFPEKAPVGYTPVRQALQSNNTVGYRGVYKNGKKYRALSSIAGKQTHLGIYDTPKEAAIVYDRAVLKANQPTSLLNFPDMVHNLDVEPKCKKYKRSSSTGYKGVSMRGKKFQARIGFNGRKQWCNIGSFDTAIDAALAYDQAAIKAGRKKSTLNFPDGLPILKQASIFPPHPLTRETDLEDGESFLV